MIPYDIDPSLHSTEPAPAVLDDGFSPPQTPLPGPAAGEAAAHPEAQPPAPQAA